MNKKRKNKIHVKYQQKTQGPSDAVTQHSYTDNLVCLSSDDELLSEPPLKKCSPQTPTVTPAPIPVVPRGGEYETMEINHERSQRPLDREKQKQEKIPSHWLDVSMLDVQTPLIFEAFDKDGKLENGRKTRTIFKSLYNKFGKFESEITCIGIEEDHIRLYFDDSNSLIRIKNDLEYIIAHENVDLKLFVRIPRLQKPSIQFISNYNVKDKKKVEWTNQIKKLNKWPKESTVILKESLPTEDIHKYRIKVIIDSQIRMMIEEENGIIFVCDGAKVEVLDDFDLIRCQKCYAIGHSKFNCKRIRSKCFFCSQVLHPGPCSIKYYPNLWYCGVCKVRGHTAVSKDCPYLMKILKCKLEQMDHKYKFVFLDRDLGRDICESILDEYSKSPNVSQETLKDSSTSHQRKKTLNSDKSLVDLGKIEDASSERFYQRLLGHLGHK